MSDFLQQAIEDAMMDNARRIREALEQMTTPPLIIESTAIVLDATPVLLPMPGEKETK